MAYNNNNSQLENEEIEIFREYLRINTAQPNPNYGQLFKITSSPLFTFI